MGPNLKKLSFYIVWLLILSFGPISVFRFFSLEAFLRDPFTIVNLTQRVLGTMAFSLLFFQIILGSYMERLIEKFGAWIFKFHTREGLLVYLLILFHPLMQMVLDFKNIGPFAPLFTILPGKDMYLNLGKLALLLITMAVVAAYFRTDPVLRAHWRKFHILNYFAFFIVAVHSFFLGTDVTTLPFYAFYIFAVATVSIIGFIKLSSRFMRKKETLD